MPNSPISTIIDMDPREITPCLAGYEVLEIQQAVATINMIVRHRINLASPLSEQQSKAVMAIIEVFRKNRQIAVQFGAERAADIVRNAGSLSQARKQVLEYAYGKGAGEDKE